MSKGRYHHWLRNVGDSLYFSIVGRYGFVASTDASLLLAVRPFILQELKVGIIGIYVQSALLICFVMYFLMVYRIVFLHRTSLL